MGANGSTTYGIIKDSQELADNMITIKVDKEYLEEQPLVTIAKTIIHETVHVQMALLMTGNEAGNFPGTINEGEIATFYEDFFQNENEEHNFIANKYLPTIKNEVQELMPVFETQDKISYISSLNLYNGSTLLEQWDWDHFYAIISLRGLESTDFFNTFINNPSNGIDSILYSVYTNKFEIRNGSTNEFTINIE